MGELFDPGEIFGNVREFDFAIRLPAFTELRDWLLAAGFASVEGYGRDGDGHDVGPLTIDSSRMVVVATKALG